jgi:TRAP-type C4-dicarboxylate transport system substrate-binding protein
MLWEGLEQADEFRRTDEYVEMKSSLENKFGIKIMGMYSSGQRHIWTGNKQVVLPMDLKNLKIRVSELDDSIEQGKSLQMQVYQAFGAYPLYVPLSDVTAGIRSGVIDGMDGNAADIITNRLSKVIRHCVLTNHAITIMVPVLSVKTWKSLTPDQQKVLESEMERYETNVREIMLKGEVDYIDKLEEEGITFTTLTDQQHMQYKSIINSTVKNYIMSTGNNIGGSGK